MSDIAKKFFSYRSYTPIPFILIMLFYNNSNIWSLIIGFFIALAGEAIRFWGVGYAGSETRTTGNVGGSQLIVSGPFSYVRNPLYLGNILIYSGIGIMSFALFPFLQIIALVFFIIQYHFIVKEEEAYLKNTFGNNYQTFLENVPRFFPRFTPFRIQNLPQPSFNSQAALKSERRTFQALILVIATIILIWFLRRF
jgi:protein-S-isoprenylcysteine O-methyltransferase Ste14